MSDRPTLSQMALFTQYTNPPYTPRQLDLFDQDVNAASARVQTTSPRLEEGAKADDLVQRGPVPKTALDRYNHGPKRFPD